MEKTAKTTIGSSICKHLDRISYSDSSSFDLSLVLQLFGTKDYSNSKFSQLRYLKNRLIDNTNQPVDIRLAPVSNVNFVVKPIYSLR